jgi:hypothetical protein
MPLQKLPSRFWDGKQYDYRKRYTREGETMKLTNLKQLILKLVSKQSDPPIATFRLGEEIITAGIGNVINLLTDVSPGDAFKVIVEEVSEYDDNYNTVGVTYEVVNVLWVSTPNW